MLNVEIFHPPMIFHQKVRCLKVAQYICVYTIVPGASNFLFKRLINMTKTSKFYKSLLSINGCEFHTLFHVSWTTPKVHMHPNL